MLKASFSKIYDISYGNSISIYKSLYMSKTAPTAMLILLLFVLNST